MLDRILAPHAIGARRLGVVAVAILALPSALAAAADATCDANRPPRCCETWVVDVIDSRSGQITGSVFSMRDTYDAKMVALEKAKKTDRYLCKGIGPQDSSCFTTYGPPRCRVAVTRAPENGGEGKTAPGDKAPPPGQQSAQPAPPPPPAAPPPGVSEVSFSGPGKPLATFGGGGMIDFGAGRTANGTIVGTHEIAVTNSGTGRLRIESAQVFGTNAGDFKVTVSGAFLGPGETAKVTVSYAPKSRGGHRAVVAIKTSASSVQQNFGVFGRAIP